MNYKTLVLITAALLFVLFGATLLTFQEHVIFYQEQHSLFLFSKAYIEKTLAADGLVGLAGAFTVQFHHIPLLGAAIVAAMLAGIYLGTEYLIFKLTGRRDFLQLGAAVAVALYFTQDGIDENPGIIALTFLGVGAACALVALAGHFLPKPKSGGKLDWKKAAVPLVMLAVFIGAGRWMVAKDYNRAERAMILAGKAAASQDWERCLQITESYLATGRENRLMQYLRCLARAKRGELLDHVFDYPMKGGTASLVFPWTGDSRDSEYGHLAHEAVGDINAAHHWVFEAMTVWGETGPHLLNLARYNVALGRPAVARKFTSLLRKSLFYRGEALELERLADLQEKGGTSQDKEIAGVRYAFAGVPDTTAAQGGMGFINVKYPAADLVAIVKNDPANRTARDYLLALLMLANDQNALMENIDPEGMKAHTVQEAMLVFSMYPQEPELSHYGLTLAKETEDRYGSYRDCLRSNNLEKRDREFSNTFWEYIYNWCPTGVHKRATLAGSPEETPAQTDTES